MTNTYYIQKIKLRNIFISLLLIKVIRGRLSFRVLSFLQ
jgi:hypothetical protein